ncbi:unnamed protein product [Symbiodinium sp. CCMP2456]|nr:unnamed protein product [Symbiodinium sp. CCMP2456]
MASSGSQPGLEGQKALELAALRGNPAQVAVLRRYMSSGRLATSTMETERPRAELWGRALRAAVRSGNEAAVHELLSEDAPAASLVLGQALVEAVAYAVCLAGGGRLFPGAMAFAGPPLADLVLHLGSTILPGRWEPLASHLNVPRHDVLQISTSRDVDAAFVSFASISNCNLVVVEAERRTAWLKYVAADPRDASSGIASYYDLAERHGYQGFCRA